METGHRRVLRAIVLELRHALEGYRDGDGRWHPGDLELRMAGLGIRRDRDPLPVDELPHLSDEDRRARTVIDGYLALRRGAGASIADAVGEFVRETAYTWANRLIALRCMEARELIDEAVLQKEAYGGRSLEHYRLSKRQPELCTGDDDGLFAMLAGVFQACAASLPMLFDPNAPGVALRPSPAALKRVVALLSGTESVRGQPAATSEVFAAPDALGWAYQYWNTEEKDRVFETLRTRKGAKIQGADIIPATQLYTEPYMVDFLVQNSLGATWAGMRPDTRLVGKWPFFVRDADRAPVGPKPVSEITFLDPACGSGHFLIVAFDLFFDMYLEEGEVTDPEAICRSILTRNLYGIDIDERAVQIAEAAMWMKAAERCPGFEGCPTNLVATNIRLPHGQEQLKAFLLKHPEDAPLRPALEVVFEGLAHADELGSLLQVEEPVERELRHLRERELAEERKGRGELFEPVRTEEGWAAWRAGVVARLRTHFAAAAESADAGEAFFGRAASRGLALFDALARRYDVVAANPPYMGSGNMAEVVKRYVGRHYEAGKRDLYAAFLLRCLALCREAGRAAMVTQQSWMFLRSFTDLRDAGEAARGFRGVLRDTTVEGLAHLGPHGFEEITGEVVNSVLFVLAATGPRPGHRMTAFRLVGPASPRDKASLLADALRASGTHPARFRPVQARFLAIPQSPLCYWLRERFFELLSGRTLGDVADVCQGLATANDDRFVRFHWEAPSSGWLRAARERRWVPFEKGGGYGKWYGHHFWLVDWEHSGARIKASPTAVVRNEQHYFKEGWTYSYMARGSIGVRALEVGSISSDLSAGVFPREASAVSLCEPNARLSSFVVRSISPKIQLRESYVSRVPISAARSDLFACAEPSCLALKRHLVALEPTERSFDPDLPSRDAPAVAAVLHALEGLSEREVFGAYGIEGEDLKAVLDETGTPAGWFPLLAGYDAIPEVPAGIDVPSPLLGRLASGERVALTGPELADLRRRLRALYEAGPGARDADEDAPDAAGDDEAGEAAAVGARIPIPAETFIEELSQRLEIHPVSVYWLLRQGIEDEGWRCLPEERRVAADRVTVTVLRLLGHRWPRQVEAGESIPDWADRDGVIPLTDGAGEPPLVDRVRTRLAAEGDAAAFERDFAELFGKPLDRWLETDFFRHHVRQFRKRPPAWQIQSGRYTAKRKPAFACLIHCQKVDEDTIPKIRTQYVGPLRQRLETEMRGIEAVPEAARSERQDRRLVELSDLVKELRDFDARLAEVVEGGFSGPALSRIASVEPLDKWCSPDGARPHPADRDAFVRQEAAYHPDVNDGVRVNIAPLQRAGLLAADVLASGEVAKAIDDRAEWRAAERRWCREGRLPRPGWWPQSEGTYE